MTSPTPPAPAGPAAAETVAAWLQGGGSAEDVAAVVAAVNAVVRRWCTPSTTLEDGTPVTAWDADVVLGATMLAGRLWRRRNSPAGVESFAGDAAVYVQRNDPDVALLLQMGTYAKPAVG